ncbi:MAG: hypothetical protein LEGION0403_FIIPPAGN_01358 [Legionella sp.]|uniref:hypothetical protein n=1 Tax=Legionella sp. TaxID=459 RepID=UPI003D140C14
MLSRERAQQIQDILNGNEAAWREWNNTRIAQDEITFIQQIIALKRQQNPDDPYTLILSARLYMRNNEVEQAIKLYEQACAKGSTLAMNTLALYYYDQQQYQQAADFLGQAIVSGSSWAKEIYSDHSFRFSSLFVQQIKSHIEQRVNTAEQQDGYMLKLVEFLLQKQSTIKSLYYYKMRLHLQLNESTEATQCYEALVAEDSITTDDLNDLATANLSDENIEKACVLFYKAYLKGGDEESLKTLHLTLRDEVDGNFQITEKDNKQLTILVLTHHAQFNTEMFAKFLEIQKPAILTLILENQLTFNQLAEITLKKEKLARRELFKNYYQEYWDDYFKKHLHYAAAYLIDLNDPRQIILFIQSLTPEQQQELTDFLLQQTQKNLWQERIINTCNYWESTFYFLLYVSTNVWLWSLYSLVARYEAINDSLHWHAGMHEFWSNLFTTLSIIIFVIPHAGIAAATSLISFVPGLVSAIIGLGFTITNTLTQHDLHQRNEEYGGKEKLNTLQANLQFFLPATKSTASQLVETQEELADTMAFLV